MAYSIFTMCAAITSAWFQNIFITSKGNPHLLSIHSFISPSPFPLPWQLLVCIPSPSTSCSGSSITLVLLQLLDHCAKLLNFVFKKKKLIIAWLTKDKDFDGLYWFWYIIIVSQIGNACFIKWIQHWKFWHLHRHLGGSFR